ncbi:MAG: type III-A CRISPR-associated RAMP protein Csm3 [Candidatus Muiribacteriaceae bacterium]
MRLTNKINLKFRMTAETGLHIGGNKGVMEIGGVDNPVLRNPVDNYPYVPGSSLKGKIRALLEYSEGIAEKGRHECDKHDCSLCKFFGSAKGDVKRTGRVIFRDSFVNEQDKKMLAELDTDLLYTENKKENTLDRITSEANPRDLERVPAGTGFDVEIVASIFDDDYKHTLKYLKKGLQLLEYDYLGGSGTRGSGRVSFKYIDCEILDINDKKIDKNEIRNIILGE